MYLIRLLLQYFEENYFSASLNAKYENLNFTGTVTTLLMLVGGICLGVLIASFIIVFEKRVVGKFIRLLLARGAESAESALSLADLGLGESGFIKRELSRASVSRKLVSVVNAAGEVTTYEDELRQAFPEEASEEKASEPSAEDDGLVPAADRENAEATAPKRSFGAKAKDFFFEKKFKPRAIDFATARFFIPEALRYRAELRFREKGSSPWWLVLATVLVLALFLLCLRFIPAFVGMLDVSISNLKGK